MELPLHSSGSRHHASLRTSSSVSLHSLQHNNHDGSSVHHQSLTIDTAAGVGLPSPEPSPDFYKARDPMSLESKRMSEEQMRSSKKAVKEFYREQNELIDDLIDPRENREGAAEEEEKNLVK
ncbi:hypothetical protein CPB97_011602, partial [Podila verticillata]